MKRLLQSLCLVLLLICAGCGTMLSHFGDCGSAPPAGVYRGVVADAGLVAAPAITDDPKMWAAVPIGLIDLPFSLTADTLIFPFDLADYIKRKQRANDRKQQGPPVSPDRDAPAQREPPGAK